jgi:hypothetical protein
MLREQQKVSEGYLNIPLFCYYQETPMTLEADALNKYVSILTERLPMDLHRSDMTDY